MNQDDRPITRYELDRSRDEAVRLATAESLRLANEQSQKIVVAAVEAVVTSVTLQIGMSEKTQSAKIDGLRSSVRWQVIAGLIGGQTVAGLAAAYMTGHGQAVEKAALAFLVLI